MARTGGLSKCSTRCAPRVTSVEQVKRERQVQRSVTIENYKGIRKLTVPELAPFTLIGGQNDVGKSSFLEAIFLFFDRQNPAALFSHLSWRNVGTIEGNASTVWETAFHQLDTSEPIIITMRDTNGVEQDVRYRIVQNYVAQQSFSALPVQNIERPILETQGASNVALGVVAKQGSKTLQNTYVTVGLGGITSAGQVHKTENRPAVYLGFMRTSDPGSAGRLTKIMSEKKEEKYVKILQLIDDRIEKIAVGAISNGPPFIMAQLKDLPRLVPINFLGSGVAIVLTAALAISAAAGGTVLIDEIETGIHHSVLPDIISALSDLAYENKTQIIATTHSYECIKNTAKVFKNKEAGRFAYLRIDRVDNKGLVAKIYPNDALEFALESEWEVR